MTFPQAVVFDLDGVLIATEDIWDEVRRGLAADEGRPWPDAATPAMMGMSTREWATYLVTDVGLSGTWEQAAQRTIDGMAARYHEHLPVIDGAAEAVRRMAEIAPVAIASSSPRRLIDTVVDELGLTDVLAHNTVSTEEVDRGKPAPDGYLKACELLGADPTRSVAVEDSTNGLKSAHNAGMVVVCIPPAFHPPTAEAEALATVVLPDLAHLDAALVRSLE